MPPRDQMKFKKGAETDIGRWPSSSRITRQGCHCLWRLRDATFDLRRGPARGVWLAYGSLASRYGKGVTQNYIKAHKWYSLAASRLPLGEVRDGAARNRDNIEAKMTPSQVAEAQRLASEWKPK